MVVGIGTIAATISYLVIAFLQAATDVVVAPQSFDLGEVSLGDSRTLNATVYNKSWRNIKVAAASSRCGCIKALISPAQIPSGGASQLTIDVRAPRVPDVVSEAVHLTSSDGQIWSVPISFRANAVNWFTPSPVLVRLDSHGRGSEVVHINTQKAGVVQAAENEELRVAILRQEEKLIIARLDIESDSDGTAILDILDMEERHVVLTLPIEWRVRQDLVWYPRTIRLPVVRVSSSNEDRLTSLIVTIDPALAGCELVAQPLHPWLSVLAIERRSSNVLRLRVAIRDSLVPAKFTGPILDLRLKGRRDRQYEVFGEKMGG